ncbi:MAG: MarR family transcriptional regulator [Actinomycetota bacterium]
MESAPDLVPWELLVRFHRRAIDQLGGELEERFGLGIDEYDVLHRLAIAGEPMRMTDLAASLLVANSSCTRIVGRLVDLGHVERRAGAEDRRQVLVDLTVDGRRMYRRMAVEHGRGIRRVLVDHLEPGEGDAISGAMRRVLDALDPAD